MKCKVYRVINPNDYTTYPVEYVLVQISRKGVVTTYECSLSQGWIGWLYTSQAIINDFVCRDVLMEVGTFRLFLPYHMPQRKIFGTTPYTKRIEKKILKLDKELLTTATILAHS